MRKVTLLAATLAVMCLSPSAAAAHHRHTSAHHVHHSRRARAADSLEWDLEGPNTTVVCVDASRDLLPVEPGESCAAAEAETVEAEAGQGST